jgi:hypothetical protein
MQVFEQNSKLGYYTVGNKTIYNKIEALMAADHGQWPTWHFNDGVYDALDWSVEPAFDIGLMYAQRARQLREEYDYIVIFFSGGADSSTVLNSFIKNNLHVDEVVIGHPESGLRDWDRSVAADPRYTVSEYYHTVVPQLKQLEIDSPSTRITINDYFQDMIDAYKSDDWIVGARDYFHPSFISRYSKKSLDHVKKICESGRRVAFVYGVDKPRIAVFDNWYHCYFLDILANTSTWDLEAYPNAATEFFYWTPDYPLLPVKQAHLVANWLDTDQAKKFRRVVEWPPRNYEQNQILKTIYDRSIREPIYPDWNFDYFQTHKSTSAISAEQDAWFFQAHKNTHLYDTWTAGIDHLKKIIPERFIQKNSQGEVHGLVGFISKMHRLRPVAN